MPVCVIPHNLFSNDFLLNSLIQFFLIKVYLNTDQIRYKSDAIH